MFPLFVILIIFFNSVLAKPDPSPTLVTKLIHYLSFDSPFYNTIANKSAIEISYLDLKHSIARASYLTSNNNNSNKILFDDNNVAIDTRLSAASPPNGFLAHIQFGSELLDQFVVMDTGSSLTWIHCEPCGFALYEPPKPVFNPLDSSTFRKENCRNLWFCDYSIRCDNKGTCSYTKNYAGGQTSKGYLARDSIKFGGSEELLLQFGFGCSKATKLPYNGILGLSNYKTSIIYQMQASEFAYCLGNISDRGYAYNMLSIGNTINVSRKTKLIIQDKYYVTLEAIKFDGIPLDIDASSFQRNPSEYTGGMVVDTGTTYTYMPRVVVKKIEEKIIDVIEYYSYSLTPNKTFKSDGYPMLCYDGLLTRDLHGWFPIVTLQFEGEFADMDLTYENMFKQMDDQSFCSIVVPSESEGLEFPFSILGNMMQQYFYISYNLVEMTFAFERIDCEYMVRDGFSGPLPPRRKFIPPVSIVMEERRSR
ncbi:hypothetical protein CASFOL_041083 [Castilleja foliolosa]|uniref:Peptidase A1 domain-containing protein n=1 Tax=Castilleja foliolosa TaxID=1961234 RepID=A0ABD3BF39_9LAMI